MAPPVAGLGLAALAATSVTLTDLAFLYADFPRMPCTDPGWSCSACSLDISDVRTITMVWPNVRLGTISSSLIRTSLSVRPMIIWPSIRSGSEVTASGFKFAFSG